MCDHHHLRTSAPAGEIEHVNFLSENIGGLFMNEDYSDIILRVEDKRFHAHKVILAARSEYFRALLFGGLRESKQECAEIELKETNSTAFHHLLKYIYTGRINLVDLKEDVLLEVLGLAHRYGFVELESSISDYLKAVLNIRNVCLIFDIASMYNLKSLCETCCEFMDRNASDIIQSENFFSLSSAALQEVISRDSFCAQEIEIFRAVQQWSEKNPEEDIAEIVRQVRLPLMDLDELLNVVRESGMISADAILDAIKTKNQNRNMELNYRGFLTPEENVATLRYGAQVIRGEMKTSLLDGDSQNYDLDRGFTRHPIDDNNGQGICVKLANACIVNTVKILLWDKDMRSYSFYIEVSMDDQDWVRVIDHTRYLCRSWQYLRFPARVVKYVKIMGTHNTVNRVFHLVSFECLYSNAPFQLDNGILVPKENVATIQAKACVIEGVSRSRNALINGDTKNYDWDSGYTCHQLGSGAIVVQLAQPYVIGSMRLLLWDCDGRSYSYYIEVSTNQQHWTVVADKTKEACRSWQILTFEKRPITFIKIVGTHNTANEVFHCVHFECPADPAALAEYESKKANAAECGQNKSQNPLVLPPSQQQLQNHQLLGGAALLQPAGAEGGYQQHQNHGDEPQQGMGNAIVHGPHLGPGAHAMQDSHEVNQYGAGEAGGARGGVLPMSGAHGRGGGSSPGRGPSPGPSRAVCASPGRGVSQSQGRGSSPSTSRGGSHSPGRGSTHERGTPHSPGRGASP